MYLMKPYDEALQEILDSGIKKQDRTGVGTIAIAGLSKTYDLSKGCFPLVTKRKMFPKSVFAELLWFLSGSTKNQYLEALGAKFWGKWCDENNPKYVALRKKYGYEPGDFGPIYGFQLRHFGGIYKRKWYHKLFGIGNGFDQLAYIIDKLKNDPFNRRILFDLWNPAQLEMMALPPCHYTYQVIVTGDNKVNGIMTQRSVDTPVGCPANIQFYSALTIMLAQQCGREAGTFVHHMNDVHIYLNQIEQVKEYLSRTEIPSPKLTIKKAKDIYSYTIDDFIIEDYNSGPKIDMPIAV